MTSSVALSASMYLHFHSANFQASQKVESLVNTIREALIEEEEDVQETKVHLTSKHVGTFNKAFMEDVGQFNPEIKLDITEDAASIDSRRQAAIDRNLLQVADINQQALDSINQPSRVKRRKSTLANERRLSHLYKFQVGLFIILFADCIKCRY